jgi:hypothetical protein
MTDRRIASAKWTPVAQPRFQEHGRPNKGLGPRSLRGTTHVVRLGMLVVAALFSSRLPAQTQTSTTPATTPAPANSWDFNVSISGYVVPDGQSYFSPTFTGDHDVLHVEARYNYEAQHTGSLWVGYDLNVGKKLVLEATPMIGGVFGNVNGVAPGLEFTATYKNLQLYSANEYVFDTDTKAGNFFYTWTQLTYSPKAWFMFGYVTQRTRTYQTPVDIERGLLVQVTRKKMTYAAQIFNLGQADTTVVLSLAYSF